MSRLDLHVLLLLVAVAIVVAAHGLVLYSLWRHGRSVNGSQAPFARQRKYELAWAIVPGAIVVGTAWPAASAVLHGLAS